jgi:NADH-quinone oxidoreductase subunit L
MEGPTPVSALIHAATMVTAGVYLLVRTAPVFEAAKHVQELAAGLGAATLLIAGLVALVQTDIKRVIAYSTMSQIGYMFLGAGLGAYANAMFLLMAHAFFKALLFLTAGIVIHALAGEQDMRRMGGLRRYLPNTYWAFLIGALTLAGIPPLSGFFAKDSILASALAAGTYGQILFVVGVLGTFLTGLYAFRMVFLVFGGEPSPFVQEHLHRPDRSEPWLWMGAAVAVLSVLSVVGGWVQIPGVTDGITNFLAPTVESVVEASGSQEWLASICAVTLGVAGIAVAWAMFSARTLRVPEARGVRTVLEHKFYFDELYNGLFYWPAVALSRVLDWTVEGPIVNGSIVGVAGLTRRAGGWFRELQTGLVRVYAFAVAAGLAVLVLVFITVR